MTLGEVKQILYEKVASFHSTALVVWEKTKGVTQRPPYITLGCRNLERTQFPLTDQKGDHMYYNYSFCLEINLFTVGKKIMIDGVETGAYENTAMEDLEMFSRYIESDEITDSISNKSVTVSLNPPIRDLSEIIGSTKFNYRSMAEFVVTFVDRADGRYGIGGIPQIPNSSGGGTKYMEQAEIGVIEEVEIEELHKEGELDGKNNE